MTLTGEDYDLLALVRDGRTTFAVRENDGALRDQLQRFYMAGLITDYVETSSSVTVGGLSAEGWRVLNARS
jgi:hypothetical protein